MYEVFLDCHQASACDHCRKIKYLTTKNYDIVLILTREERRRQMLLKNRLASPEAYGDKVVQRCFLGEAESFQRQDRLRKNNCFSVLTKSPPVLALEPTLPTGKLGIQHSFLWDIKLTRVPPPPPHYIINKSPDVNDCPYVPCRTKLSFWLKRYKATFSKPVHLNSGPRVWIAPVLSSNKKEIAAATRRGGTPLTPASRQERGRQKQADLWEFETSEST